MSGLAHIYLVKGNTVTGSDLKPNNLTDGLRRRGAVIHNGHHAGNVPEDVDLVVRSTCIGENNPEIVRARELGMPVISRAEMLKEVIDGAPFSLAVTGTHGKTTTSALAAHVAEFCGKDPTAIVGGEMECFGGNAKAGGGGVVVAEVDESDGYFRNIASTCAVVTNIEREHMEHYGSFDNLLGAYTEFIGRISPGGSFVYNGEDPVIGGIARAAAARKVTFGIDGDFDVTCRNYTYARSVEFDLIARGRDRGRVRSPLMGRYNLMNILAAIAACVEAGFDPGAVIEGISSFRGVKRRFDRVGRVGGIEVIEDYAHHPTELRSVIDAARDYSEGRVIAIFQPHRYSRTRDLKREFAGCFYGADVLIMTDVYSASEKAIEGGGAKDLFDTMDKSQFEKLTLIGKEDIPESVSGIVRDGDTILVLGAGDIREISGELLSRIEGKVRK